MKRQGKADGKPLVLIADDDPTTRLLVRQVLEQAGMNVVEARDGIEALEIYQLDVPDAILLDVEMPRLDGFSVCQKIRASEKTRSTPICIITGLEDMESAERAYHLGATDFISKPIAWSALLYRVRYLLRAGDALNEIQGLMAALPDEIFVLNENGQAYEPQTELDGEDLYGSATISNVSINDLFSEEDRIDVRKHVSVALKTGEPQIFEHYNNGSKVHFETRFVARDRSSVLAIVRDVTKRKESESQIYNLAYYDRLTGLPNRQLFSRELDGVLERARQQQHQFAMLFVDLDRFKRINDTLGHSMGDELLKAVAERLDGSTRARDNSLHQDPGKEDSFRLARLGGDEFVILLHGVGSQSIASTIASRIVKSLSAPFNCIGHQLVVTPSIGIAIYPQDGESKEELLMNADSAMYRAKAAGRNNFQFYSDTMKIKSLHRLSIEGELRKAIENQDFELYYQPKVDVASWSIVGAEGLLRWNHSERGWISPADFIPVAEETGLILPLGNWVLQTACEQLKKWQHTAFDNLSVSINVSGHQVYSNDLVKNVKDALARVGVQPWKLELELTESLLIRDIETAIDALVALKGFGVGLSIDDFGTGYSSLSYLKRFPIDSLKIDRSFVRDLQSDNDDAAICAAILAMAHRLDLKVIAEGVELEEQIDYLRQYNCDQIQGYLFSKPIAVNDFEALFLEHQRTHTAPQIRKAVKLSSVDV